MPTTSGDERQYVLLIAPKRSVLFKPEATKMEPPVGSIGWVRLSVAVE